MDTHADDFQRAFVSRNWAFISEAEQQTLARATVLVAGVGLGSAVAHVLARTGIGHLIVADGDVVEISNLNRQFYTRADLGSSKAVACGAALQSINPSLTVTVVPEFLQADTVAQYVAQADVVVNTIDWEHPAQLACLEAARAQGKYALFPMNIGFGSAVFAFAPEGPRIADIAGSHLANAELKQHLAQLAYGANVGGSWEPLMQRYEASLTGAPWPSDPQLGIAVAATAAVVATACLQILLGHRIRQYPKPIILDLMRALQPD